MRSGFDHHPVDVAECHPTVRRHTVQLDDPAHQVDVVEQIALQHDEVLGDERDDDGGIPPSLGSCGWSLRRRGTRASSSPNPISPTRRTTARSGRRAHRRDVDHRRLVDNQQVAFQWLPETAPEAAGRRIDLEQPVDGPRVEARHLPEATSLPAGWGAERDGAPSTDRMPRMALTRVALPTPRPPVTTTSCLGERETGRPPPDSGPGHLFNRDDEIIAGHDVDLHFDRVHAQRLRSDASCACRGARRRTRTSSPTLPAAPRQRAGGAGRRGRPRSRLPHRWVSPTALPRLPYGHLTAPGKLICVRHARDSPRAGQRRPHAGTG